MKRKMRISYSINLQVTATAVTATARPRDVAPQVFVFRGGTRRE